jgi:DGQHR domain-containing protein
MAKAKRAADSLERRALKLVQSNGGVPIYQFCLTGEELSEIADISRVERSKEGKLIGYQRADVRKHIKDIADYLDSEHPLFPNPIILALSSDVSFTGSRGPGASDGLATAGKLTIPLRTGNRKPAWIVDGQQRSLALAQCSRKDFPVPVNAFVADNVDIQREQFLRVNNAKPLPRGLVTELLPEVDTILPAGMAQRQVPSKLCDLLSRHPDSPFFGLIRRPSMSREERKAACVTDTSVIEMLKDSLTSMSGCLFPYRNVATNETDTDGIWKVLMTYWGAVTEVFPDAWARPARESRLTHGVGIIAMGRLMDKVMNVVDPRDAKAQAQVRKDLELVAPHCHWTSGRWEGLDGMKWNDLKNIPSHRKLLASHLIRIYLREKRGHK